MEMSGRCLLELTRMSNMSKCQKRAPSRPKSIYRPLKQIELVLYAGLIGRTDQTQPNIRSPASGRPLASTRHLFELEPLDLNRQMT